MQDAPSSSRGQINSSALRSARPPRIGIDLMGSDTPPEILLQGLLTLLKEQDTAADLFLFATAEVLKQIPKTPPVTPVLVTEVITMKDDPISAVRKKKDSSINRGMRMLASKELDAFISAGNTGALLTSAKVLLPMLPGIARPALLTLLPTKTKEVAVLDVGANVSFKVKHLLQFASMGIAYQKSRGIAHPTVGLLNIGSEEKKGTKELQEAYQKLRELNKSDPDHPVFLGNIEGRDVFQSDIDVLVTDGFTGNVFLKTAEGIAAVILDHLQTVFLEERFSPLKETLSRLHHRLHYAEYPGAILCGVEGIVVKCHGDCGPEAMISSVKGTIRLVKHSFLENIKTQLTTT